MTFYFAPMEGITGYVYRNAFHDHFSGIDKYFMPFIAPNQYGAFSSREKQDTLPSHNEKMVAVPQILTNNAVDFVRTAKQLEAMGYTEVNLNLGCPSGTVVSKGKGSGFLIEVEALERFLDTIFEQAVTAISIKTRIGKYTDDEFEQLLPLFNKYPMSELIIHPRVQQDYYKHKPRVDVFTHALATSPHKLCYNGDIFTPQHYDALQTAHPHLTHVMLGRGLLANPGLVHTIQTGERVPLTQIKQFLDALCEGYAAILSGDRNVLFKMKELWYYMAYLFEGEDKAIKRIKKAQTIPMYKEAVDRLFEQAEYASQAGFSRP